MSGNAITCTRLEQRRRDNHLPSASSGTPRRHSAARRNRHLTGKIAFRQSEEPTRLSGIWQLVVLDKRRYVYPTDHEIWALRAHWADRDENFDVPSDTPLISPVLFPAMTNSHTKHIANEIATGGKGYSDLAPEKRIPC